MCTRGQICKLASKQKSNVEPGLVHLIGSGMPKQSCDILSLPYPREPGLCPEV